MFNLKFSLEYRDHFTNFDEFVISKYKSLIFATIQFHDFHENLQIAKLWEYSTLVTSKYPPCKNENDSVNPEKFACHQKIRVCLRHKQMDANVKCSDKSTN